MNTKLILLTGFDEQGRLVQAREAGFASSLAKPAKMSQLLDVLVSTLGSAAGLHNSQQVSEADAERQRVPSQSEHMILVAEDNPINQKLARLQLQKLGYTTDVVSNGREAVAAVAARSYALVLMDCQMPEMDGFQATAAIRHAEGRMRARHLPIIAMTANAMPSDREECLNAGMDDYLTKPVKVEALRAAIERWLPQSELAHDQADNLSVARCVEDAPA